MTPALSSTRIVVKLLYDKMDTLHHVQIHSAKIVACTISDAGLRETTNRRLLRQARRLCPNAMVIAAADDIPSAVELYEQGADFVYVARLHSARRIAELTARALRDESGIKEYREQDLQLLHHREEVLRRRVIGGCGLNEGPALSLRILCRRPDDGAPACSG